MSKTSKQLLTDEQNQIIKKAILDGMPPGKLYKQQDFGDIKLRTFYRRYRETAISLGVYKPINAWSEDDENYLKSVSGSEILARGDISGHSIAAIRRKRQKLGLSTRDKNVLWTAEEDARLTEISQNMTAVKIFESGEFQNRSLSSIYSRIKTLGLNGRMEKKPWSKEEENLLFELTKEELSIKDIKEHFPDRTVSAIQTKIRYLKKY